MNTETTVIGQEITKLRIKYHGLAVAILEQSKKTGKMRRDEYENIVVPYMTVIKSQPYTREDVSNILKNAHVAIEENQNA